MRYDGNYNTGLLLRSYKVVLLLTIHRLDRSVHSIEGGATRELMRAAKLTVGSTVPQEASAAVKTLCDANILSSESTTRRRWSITLTGPLSADTIAQLEACEEAAHLVIKGDANVDPASVPRIRFKLESQPVKATASPIMLPVRPARSNTSRVDLDQPDREPTPTEIALMKLVEDRDRTIVRLRQEIEILRSQQAPVPSSKVLQFINARRA